MEVRRGLESTGSVVQSCVLELWASVKKLRCHRLYSDGEAGFTLDLHWIAEPWGSVRDCLHSTGVATLLLNNYLSSSGVATLLGTVLRFRDSNPT